MAVKWEQCVNPLRAKLRLQVRAIGSRYRIQLGYLQMKLMTVKHPMNCQSGSQCTGRWVKAPTVRQGSGSNQRPSSEIRSSTLAKGQRGSGELKHRISRPGAIGIED